MSYKKRMGALFCALALLGGAAVAEERRLGDYIYVPAISAPGGVGTISLRVEGVSRDKQSGAETSEALSGVEFGVYVISGSGEVTPWANPLLPSEPMRIRTGEGETRFALPQGTEFYLRQESAPEGYGFDSEALIPVTGNEVLVRNERAGELTVRVQDSLGNPLSGVTVTVVNAAGNAEALRTDETGEILFYADAAQNFSVSETELPQDMLAALNVYLDGQTADPSQVPMKLAENRELVFEHPAAGAVQLKMTMASVDANGEAVKVPLSGVTLEVVGQMSLTTDASGQAQAPLMEGMYDVRLSYAGDEDVKLPIEAGQMIVESGATTLIELSAAQNSGRIVVKANSERDVNGGAVSFVSEQSGETYGPYEFDADGLSVSDQLPVGDYHIGLFEAPENRMIGSISYQGVAQNEQFILKVLPGEAAVVDVELYTMEQQTFALLRSQAGENGEIEEEGLHEDVSLQLISLDNPEIQAAVFDAKDGSVEIKARNGQYVLHMPAEDAARLGLRPESEPFTLPAQQEAISFADEHARLVVRSVDENGMPISGAVYMVADAAGETHMLTTDEDGEAVTPLMEAGEAVIRTKQAPEGYDMAQELRVTAEAGRAEAVQMAHAAFGTAQFTVQKQMLDAEGKQVFEPLEGVGVHLYAVENGGQGVTDIGIELVTGEDGTCSVKLAPGEYTAQVQEMTLDAGCRALQALRFTMENAKESGGTLLCMDALGGVSVQLIGGTLDDEELAQVHFELLAPEGETIRLTMQDGSFYAGGLKAGTYVLRQTQMPQGYKIAPERTVSVSGGEADRIEVTLEEYAMLSVSKTGLTFNDQLQTYMVPLTGKYGVYTMEGETLKPYPSADHQEIVWSNAAPDADKKNSVRLPASVEGTTYYLMEQGSAEGFAQDTQVYEVTLTAGENRVLDCAVSSDRGFFELSLLESGANTPVAGGMFELLNASGESVLTFATEERAYRNAMALPVGEYTLRQLTAPAGYALSYRPEMTVSISPYLTEGGSVTALSMMCMKLPESERMDSFIADVYAGTEQDLTLLSVDTGMLSSGESLIQPRMTVKVRDENGNRVNIASVVISSATDAAGGHYRARVEYALAGGGWQPSDARMTEILDQPSAISLTDVYDDIEAVRITYLNAETGAELLGAGFAPSRVTVNVQAGVEGEAKLFAETSFEGGMVYKTEYDSPWNVMERRTGRRLSFSAKGAGPFKMVSAGRDGRVSGVAFLDENANGRADAKETARYAGLNVYLIAETGEVVDTCRTDSDGRYQFGPLSGGVYTVQFDGGENVVFSSGKWFSDHVNSSVQDLHYGLSAPMVIDGDHTDYVVNAGCVFAGELKGAVHEMQDADAFIGFGGLNIEMKRTQYADEEPFVVMTDDLGNFRFTGVLPGEYEVSLKVPDGYLCERAVDGVVSKRVTISQGDAVELGVAKLSRASSISGVVRVDHDGDGLIDDRAENCPGVRVVLLRAEGGHTENMAETTTDESGAYRFDNLYAGDYSVLFELDGEWAFTRYGEDSAVFGAVSQSGMTQQMMLKTGETLDHVNAGVTIPAQMSVRVFKDAQADGVKGVYDEMLEGVSISLVRQENGEDAEAVTYKTDADGQVTFAGVSPGEYVISYQMPGQWRATKQRDPAETNGPVSCVPQTTLSTGRSEPFILSMGQSGLELTIGAMLSGSISGVAYYDDNADSKFGAEELSAEGVFVELLDREDMVLSSAATLEDGSYAFEGLAPGSYHLRFTAQEDCGFSGTERTVYRGGVQPSAEPVSTTRTIVVTAGQATDSADAGVVRMSSLTGIAWEDKNGDGVQQPEERLLASVVVHLMNGSGRNILISTTTDENGVFVFDRLVPDDYKLRMDAPDGYVFSDSAADSVLSLDTERDGRGYSSTFTLLGGAHVENVRFGLLTQGVISGRVWLDQDYDGFMAEEDDGLRGVALTLLTEDGEEVRTVQTARSGEFEFNKLMPGMYTLRASLDEDYVFTTDLGDSIVMKTDDQTADVELGELPMGGTIADLHIGALKPGSVSGVAWYDQDNDGRRQPDDAGAPQAHVLLTVLSGADAGKTYETDTAEDGSYTLEGIMPGRMQIQFTVPEGYAFAKQIDSSVRVSTVPQTDALTAQTEAFDLVSGQNKINMDAGVISVGTITGTVWEDGHYDGKYGLMENGISGAELRLVDAFTGEVFRTSMSGENGKYEIDFVRPGAYRIEVKLPNGMIFTQGGAVPNVDADQGATFPFEMAMGEHVEEINAGAIVPAALNGSVLVDANGDGKGNADESGMPGAVVTLMQGGTVVATTQTDASGAYAMPMLRPGSYRLRIALPQDTLFVQGTALEMAHADAQEAQTREYELNMGDQLQMEPVAAVYTGVISGRAWADVNTDGRMDAQEAALMGVKAELLDGQGQVIAEALVDENGCYAFHLLRVGSYALRFTLPDGQLFADRIAEPGASCVAPSEGRVAQTETFQLAMGEQKTDCNVGAIEPGRLGDSIWLDLDGNGLQDYREPLLSGVSLTLLSVQDDGQMVEKAETISDQYGYYRFENLRPGTYVLRINLADGDVLTKTIEGPLEEIDNDFDPQTGLTSSVMLYSGQTIRSLDAGLIQHGN